MRLNNLLESMQLNEMASAKLFHTTSLPAAQKILSNKEFGLTSVTGSVADEKFNRKYRYFMSASRNPVNDYVRAATYYEGVVFNLNGHWFNSHYKVVPVDYWERMWIQGHGVGNLNSRTSEQEDRILSNKPTIKFSNPSDVISSVHILLVDRSDGQFGIEEYMKAQSLARKVAITAKSLGIPVFLYDSRQSFMTQDTRKAVSLSTLKSTTGRPGERFRGGMAKYYKPWIELYYKNSTKDLSQRANDLRKEIIYSYSYSPSDFGLGNDLANEKRPNAPARKFVDTIISIMHKHHLPQPIDYVNFLRDKWKGLSESLNEDYARDEMPQLNKKVLDSHGIPYTRKYVPLSKLDPEQIDRVSDKFNQDFANSLKSGKYSPIIIDDDYRIVDGHHRYDMAKHVGLDKIKCYVVDYTLEELQDKFSHRTDDEETDIVTEL